MDPLSRPAHAEHLLPWRELVSPVRGGTDAPPGRRGPADIAAALHEDGHAGRTYELTGPEPISPRRQAEVLARALGEEVTFVELSRAEAHAHLARFMPEEVVDGTLDVLGLPLPEERRGSPDAESVLGRAAAFALTPGG